MDRGLLVRIISVAEPSLKVAQARLGGEFPLANVD